MFPQAHPDGWVAVEAPSWEAARATVMLHIGPFWAFLFSEDDFANSRVLYPLGELAQIKEGRLIVTGPETRGGK
jgi:hypothetical protein